MSNSIPLLNPESVHVSDPVLSLVDVSEVGSLSVEILVSADNVSVRSDLVVPGSDLRLIPFVSVVHVSLVLVSEGTEGWLSEVLSDLSDLLVFFLPESSDILDVPSGVEGISVVSSLSVEVLVSSSGVSP